MTKIYLQNEEVVGYSTAESFKDTSKEQFIDDSFKPYHPGLPSIAQAQINYDEFLSDHIPVLADMGDIKCVSWNVMESDAANGVAPLGQSNYGETPEQRQARYERIADAIAGILQRQQPDFFMLQEILAHVPGCDDSEGLWFTISQRLEGTSYEAATYDGKVIDTSGNITLYNRDKFMLNLEDTPVRNQIPGRLQETLFQLGAHGLVFNYKAESSQVSPSTPKIRICNVHADYNDNPAHHEKMIHEFLNQGSVNDTSIVMGDFNCMFDTFDNIPQIITTSLAPNAFRNNKMQGACAIDGAFAKKANEKSTQVASKHIDPATGEVYEPAALTLLDDKQKPEAQIEEEGRFRAVMCLSENPFKELESLLNSSIGGEHVSIRPAINLKNQHGLAILFHNNNKNYFEKMGLPSQALQNQHTGTTSRIAYLPTETANETLRDKVVPEILKNRFMTAYFEKLQHDKMRYCGMFSCFRISRVTREMTLSDIIQHAQGADNRSRAVCRQLGWLNQDGSVANDAPDAIRSLVNSEEACAISLVL